MFTYLLAGKIICKNTIANHLLVSKLKILTKETTLKIGYHLTESQKYKDVQKFQL